MVGEWCGYRMISGVFNDLQKLSIRCFKLPGVV